MAADRVAAPRGGEAPGGREGLKSALTAFGHLAVLSAFALAQPMFNLLSENPEFFAARGSTASEIVVLALLLVIVPPAILLAVELLVGLASERAREVVHLAFVGLIASVVFVQALKKAIEAGDAVLIGLALALGALVAALYARAEPVRSFLSVLTPAPLVFLVLFLFFSDVSDLVTAGDADAKSAGGVARVPVVMVLFDEVPSTSLMDADGGIDARRYPAFASLARDATWFRNAHSIYDSTSRAVPAIMEGNLPEKERRLPTAAEHPNSIFTLLGDSHRMHVSEEATTVCPRDLCEDERLDEPFLTRLRSMADDLSLVYAHVVAPPGIENDLATVSESWGDFGGGDGGADGGGGDAADTAPAADASPEEGEEQGGGREATLGNLRSGREARFEEWIEGIRTGGRRPALNFKHALLPHVPWLYLPDGRQYRRDEPEPIPQISRQSYKDAEQVKQLQLRHLLQTGFADRELGRLLARLKELGVYDRALIVVAADHGVSFKVGQFDRRNVNRRNIDEITPVPLFVKRPGQRRARVDRSVVETIDIIPTIADVLNAKLPARTDGASAFSERVRARRSMRMLTRSLKGFIRLSVGDFERERDEELARKVELFGTGADGPDRIYRVGPSLELIGRPAAAAGRSRSRASVVEAGELRRVDLRGDFVPNWITGRVRGGAEGPETIAVAVNGTIRATGRTFRLATGGGELFGVMVPPSAFRQGANRVEILEVSGGRLLRMGGV